MALLGPKRRSRKLKKKSVNFSFCRVWRKGCLVSLLHALSLFLTLREQWWHTYDMCVTVGCLYHESLKRFIITALKDSGSVSPIGPT